MERRILTVPPLAVVLFSALAVFSNPIMAAQADTSKAGLCEIVALSARIAYQERLKGEPLPAVSADRKADFFYPLVEYARDYGYKSARRGGEAEKVAFLKCMLNADYTVREFDRGRRISASDLPK